MTAEAVEAVCRTYWGRVNAGDLAGLEDLFAEDAFFEDVALGISHQGRAAILDTLRRFFSVMPFHFDVTEIVASEHKFAAAWTASARHTAQALVFPAPTHKLFRFRGVSVGEVRDGHFQRKSDYWNVQTVLDQLT